MKCTDFLCAEGVQNAPCFFEVEIHNVERAVCSECPAFDNCTSCCHFSECLENGHLYDSFGYKPDFLGGVPF